MQALQIALLLLTPTYGLFITISQKLWVFLVQVPVKQQVLVNYIAYLFSRDYVATTVIACFSVVSYIHKLYNLKDHVHLFWYKNCCAQPVGIFCTTQSLLLSVTVFNTFESAMFKAIFTMAFYWFLRVGKVTPGGKVVSFLLD